MTILAVALVSLIEVFSTGLRGLGVAQANSAVMMQARSTLEGVGSLIPLNDGTQDGVFDDGARWTAVILPYKVEDDATFDALRAAPYEVEVTVTSKDGVTVTLRSLRLGRKE